MYLTSSDKLDLVTRIMKATEHPLVKLFASQKVLGIERDDEAITDLGLWDRCEILIDEVSAEAVRGGFK